MFNLESAIAEWREQMQAGGLRTQDTLDELESHLRAEFAALSAKGLPNAEAFPLALAALGDFASLRTEFDKLNSGESCRAVVILSRLWAGLMILGAISLLLIWFVHWRGLPHGDYPKRSGLFLYGNIVGMTAGYCAAFCAGAFGLLHVGYRFFHGLTPLRERSLQRAACRFTFIAAVLVVGGMICGMLWSRQHLYMLIGAGGHREVGAWCGCLWLIASVIIQRTVRLTSRSVARICLAGDIIIYVAWFAVAGGSISRTTGHWSYDRNLWNGMVLVFVAVHLLIMAIPEKSTTRLLQRS